MSKAIKAAIEELQGQIENLEEEARQIKQTVNLLCTRDGAELIYPGADSPSGGITQIVGDTFFGQRLNTAIRRYLEMRRAAGLGSALVRDIHEALWRGGYEFPPKESTAIRGLRATLSKSTHTFRKVPSGGYGLSEWYPHTKAGKGNGKAEGSANAAASAEAPDHDDTGDAEEKASDKN